MHKDRIAILFLDLEIPQNNRMLFMPIASLHDIYGKYDI